MTPEYLSFLALPTVGRTTRYTLRNESDHQTIPAKSQQYYHSFLPSVTRAWNRLSEETKTSPSVTAFKHKLQYHYCGKRIGQKHHTRLRLNRSSLQQNAFSKNITNDPQCEFGEVEDTEHYLLNCDLLQNLHEELLNTVTTYCQLTLNELLYGNANLSESENTTIFLQFKNLSYRLNASDPTTATTTTAITITTTTTTAATYFPRHTKFVITLVIYASCLSCFLDISLRPSGHLLEWTGVILH